MSRVVRPVRPKAVSWKSEGRVVMHHCNISITSLSDWVNLLMSREGFFYLEAQDSVIDDSEMPNVVL